MHRPIRIFEATAAIAFLIAAGAQPSKADLSITFDVSGTFATGSMNGTVTFDETNNTMPVVDIDAPGTGAGPFTTPGFFSNPSDGSTGTFVGIGDASGDTLFLQFPTATIANVAGYDGGPLVADGTVIDIPSSGSFDFLVAGSLTPLSTVPEPSSLLLAGTVLGLLVFPAMRR